MSLRVLGDVPPPEEVKIRLLQPCNLRCGMCWHWQDPRGEEKRLEGDLVLRVLGELGAMSVRRVKLTGGEPTLRTDLPRLVSAARAAGLSVTLATNAVRLSPERTRELVRAGVDKFHVSLDSGVAEVHDAIRGAPGAFDRAVRALGYLCEAHPRTRRTIATVVQRRNIGTLWPLVEVAARTGVREIYLLQVHTEPWCAGDRPTLDEHEAFFFEELPVLLDAGARRGVRIHPSPLFEELLPLPAVQQAAALRDPAARTRFADELAAYAQEAYGRRFYARHPCREIQGRCQVAETGDVYPCCHTEVPDLSMGNVRDEPFAAIWARAPYRAFRDPVGPLPRHLRCLTCKDAHYA